MDIWILEELGRNVGKAEGRKGKDRNLHITICEWKYKVEN